MLCFAGDVKCWSLVFVCFTWASRVSGGHPESWIFGKISQICSLNSTQICLLPLRLLTILSQQTVGDENMKSFQLPPRFLP